MKAVAVAEIGGLDRLELMELPDPEPAAGEVLVRIEAAGVNEVDTLFREGYLDAGTRPMVMGSDFSGVVERAGEGVEDLTAGDEVYGYKLLGNGTYAELATIPAAWMARKPASLSHVEAAAIPCVGLTAHQAIELLDVRIGETVVITAAAGGVGTVAVQLAADRGARVLGTASGANETYVRELGAEAFVDYRAGDWVKAVRDHFPGGADIVLTCRGGETKRRSPEALRDGGRLVWITGDERPGPPMERLISGSYSGGMPRRDTLEALAKLVDAGRLRLPVQEVYPLTEAAAAQRRVAEGHVRGKLVVTTSTSGGGTR
jgi:NADPH:quinone reductase-like Zn-dependent oxidoreductase